MNKSKYNNYTVYEWKDESDSFHIEELLSLYPSIVEGMFLVISSWDSGTYQPTEKEFADGWQLHSKLAHSPRVEQWSSLPFEVYDEWYIFDHPVNINDLEPLVNYLGFSPIKYDWQEKRELFWNQVEKYRPIHVIGDGKHLFLVTRDDKLKIAEPNA